MPTLFLAVLFVAFLKQAGRDEEEEEAVVAALSSAPPHLRLKKDVGAFCFENGEGSQSFGAADGETLDGGGGARPEKRGIFSTMWRVRLNIWATVCVFFSAFSFPLQNDWFKLYRISL